MERGSQRNRKARKHLPTSVRIDPILAEYLQLLAEKTQRDRTYLINAIISDYAHRHRQEEFSPPLKVIPM